MQLPARIGKYELQEFLGGGMSHVYRAQDTVIGRTVAVKILTEAGCADAEAKARFLAEARMAGGLAHDNVLSIYDFGEDAGKPFMVMEFLRGEDLRATIKNGRTGDTARKLKIALDIARALEYCHSQKIIHRDIKPENIHITTAGAVKLMDFGIAKTEGLSMTRAGFVLGTPYYMAPEQVLGKDVTEQVDIYAFGVLLFELFTGAKPISGDTVERIFYSILHEPLDLAPLRTQGAPEAVCQLVADCTAKDPAQRPQGFGAVVGRIQHIQAPTAPISTTMTLAAATAPAPVAAPPKPVAPPPVAAPPASNTKWLVIGALAAAVIAGGAFVAFKPSKAPAPAPAVATLAPKLQTPTGEMELVPAGPFLFGQNKEQITLPAFYMDQTEVTNEAYAKFCHATNRPLPPDFQPDHPDYPVTNVTIVDAQEFAKWAGKRLPNAREWEKAARGTDGRLYPWGPQPDPKLANVKDNPTTDTKGPRSVHSFHEGESPYGIENIVGNVWEFVDQFSTPSPRALEYFKTHVTPPATAGEPWYTIRGLSFNEPLIDSVLWDSTTIPSRYRDKNVGFRCVKDQ